MICDEEGHNWQYSHSETVPDDEGMIREHFVCDDCDEETYEDS